MGVQMDPVSMEKLRAMKMYNKRRRQQLLPTPTLYMVTTFVLGLLLSSPIWVPRLCSFLKFFFLISLPDMGTALFSPKCLFIVCNLIVAFLVGESRLAPRPPSPVQDIYEEYVKRNSVSWTSNSTTSTVKAASALVDKAWDGGGDLQGGDCGEEEMVEEGEEEELHKRVEDFIARVKRQRRLEAAFGFLDAKESKKKKNCIQRKHACMIACCCNSVSSN